jgi:hypothetical protein
MTELSQEWLQGYRIGYTNQKSDLHKSSEYYAGYNRGLSDAIKDFKIILKPKKPSIFGDN